MTGSGGLVEVQGTAEGKPFSEDESMALLKLAKNGIAGTCIDAEGRYRIIMSRRLEGKVVIATHNAGKLKEMRELLAPHGIEAVSAGELNLPEPDETGLTFAANATIKAKSAA